MDDAPIGIFDSGFGGLSILRALVDLVPGEDLVYLGDTGRYPYGPRPLEEVRGFALEIADYLIERFSVKMIVVACNTASAAALELLENSIPVPVIGVIDAGVRAMLQVTRSGRVGVIGTVGTVSSGAYQRQVLKAQNDLGTEVSLTCCACPGFVEFVERGELHSEQVHILAERLLKPVIENRVDTLLLGCTHYPFLARTLQDVIGSGVVLVSSAEESAFEIRDLLLDKTIHSHKTEALFSLESKSLSTRPDPNLVGTQTYLSSGNTVKFKNLGSQLLGLEIESVLQVSWDL